MRFLPANAQEIGARPDQQDAFGFSDPRDHKLVAHGGIAAVVADGMGGLAHGCEASRTAVRVFLQTYASKAADTSIPDALLHSIQQANQAVALLAREKEAKNQLGTTLAAAVVHQELLYWISAGDSRVYLFRDGSLTRLTRDHNYAADLQDQVNRGRITLEQAIHHPDRESLTSYLGREELPKVERSLRGLPLQTGDSIMLCTDGLYRSLSEDEAAAILAKEHHNACEALVESTLARKNPQQDNVTIVAIQCSADSAISAIAKAAAAAGALIAVVVAAFFAVRQGTPEVVFQVDHGSIRSGESATLTWQVKRGDASIQPQPGRVAASGKYLVSPTARTTYSLTAVGKVRQIVVPVTVDVAPPSSSPPPPPAPPPPAAVTPVIRVFHVNPPTAKPGDPVTLSWEVDGSGAEVMLDGAVVPTSGRRTIKADYKPHSLLARSGNGSVTSSVTVSRPPAPPIIKEFSANPETIDAGHSSTLRWMVGGKVEPISIAPATEESGAGEPVLSGGRYTGSVVVTPAKTTTYVLTASGPGGTLTRSITVTVNTPAPPAPKEER